LQLSFALGKSCQRKAWYDGHKGQCKKLSGIYGDVIQSVELIDSIHFEAQDEAQGKGLRGMALRPAVDYMLLAVAVVHSGCCQGQCIRLQNDSLVGLEGPSMHFFYENMKRIKHDKWWPLDRIEPYLRPCHLQSATKSFPKASNNMEDECFWRIASAMCYNLADFFCDEHQEDVLRGTEAFHHIVSELYYHSTVPTKEKGERITPTRFLQLYDIIGKRSHLEWKKDRRHFIKEAIGPHFREAHHKSTSPIWCSSW
jgi:hypothetical protein